MTTYTKPSISGYNSNPPADDGSNTASNEIKWATHKNKLADPIKTYADTINDNVNTAFGTLNGSAGSAEIGFIQSGTGAVSKTVEDVIRDGPVSSLFYINGTGDEHSQMQHYLDRVAGKTAETSPGTYTMASGLTIHSGTYWRAKGQGKVIIKADATLPGDSALLINAEPGTDSDICIDGITFDGNNNASRTAELIAIYRVSSFKFNDSVVQNVGYIGMAVAGCDGVLIGGLSKFSGCGKTTTSSEGGAALRIVQYPGGYNNQNVVIEDAVQFFNNNWSALYLTNTTDGHIGGKYYNNKESVIYTYTCVDIDYHPIIDLNTLMNISAHGIEAGGVSQSRISGAQFRNIVAYPISLTDCTDVDIDDNLFWNSSTDTGSSRRAAISVNSIAANNIGISVVDNRIKEDTNNLEAFVVVAGSYGPTNGFTFKGNKNSNVTLTTGLVSIYDSAQGTGWDVDYKQSYTATATGMTTSPTGSVEYAKNGPAVTLNIPLITGTSNATTFTLTGMPADIRPLGNRQVLVRVQDNGGSVTSGVCTITNGGVIQLYSDASGSAFTNSGTKSVQACNISYLL